MKKLIGYCSATLIAVALWAALALILRSPALPLPTTALATFFRDFPAMLPDMAISLMRIAVAIAVGTALALPLGLAIGRSPKLDAIGTPLSYLLYPIPKVVFLPVLIVLLGLGNAPKIVLIAVVIFFQTLVTTRDAAHNIDPALMDTIRALGTTRWQKVRLVILPAVLPDLFTALRINVGTSIAILFFAETIADTTGIGGWISNAWSMLDYQAMFAGIIAMALLGVLLYEAVALSERLLVPWKYAGRQTGGSLADS
ncbi:MAG: ABC transporter permease [Actinomycetia bacterium]|nr:ABC transporter permease [Actinomycetes bacterium]